MSLLPRNSLFDFHDYFENFFTPEVSAATSNGHFSPRVDIRDKGERYEITADLPGVKKKDLSVTVENGVVTIEASTEKEETQKEKGKIIRKERRTGKYLRSFSLSSDVNESDVHASFKDGVLTLDVPKSNPEKSEAKKIAIE